MLRLPIGWVLLIASHPSWRRAAHMSGLAEPPELAAALLRRVPDQRGCQAPAHQAHCFRSGRRCSTCCRTRGEAALRMIPSGNAPFVCPTMSDCTCGVGRSQVAYEAVIGIECHVQLNTHTKAFCGCSTSKAPINVNVCPICLAHPVHPPCHTPQQQCTLATFTSACAGRRPCRLCTCHLKQHAGMHG